jgi:hypothetical protein
MKLGTILLSGLIVVPAGRLLFGGWAVVTVENPPERLVVDAPYTLEYTVRQHGVELHNGLRGKVEASSGARVVRADAKSIGAGRYRATLTVPTTGAWTIKVHSGFGPSSTTLLPISAANAGAPIVALAEPERGKHLFVAKGCATCHVEMKVIPVDVRTATYDPQFVSRLLENPKAMPKRHSVDVAMPDLNLSTSEIAALSAYLAGPNSTAAR